MSCIFHAACYWHHLLCCDFSLYPCYYVSFYIYWVILHNLTPPSLPIFGLILVPESIIIPLLKPCQDHVLSQLFGPPWQHLRRTFSSHLYVISCSPGAIISIFLRWWAHVPDLQFPSSLSFWVLLLPDLLKRISISHCDILSALGEASLVFRTVPVAEIESTTSWLVAEH